MYNVIQDNTVLHSVTEHGMKIGEKMNGCFTREADDVFHFEQVRNHKNTRFVARSANAIMRHNTVTGEYHIRLTLSPEDVARLEPSSLWRSQEMTAVERLLTLLGK